MNKNLQIALAVASAAAGIVAVILYFEGKEERKNKRDIAKIELQLKQIQLAEKQSKA